MPDCRFTRALYLLVKEAMKTVLNNPAQPIALERVDQTRLEVAAILLDARSASLSNAGQASTLEALNVSPEQRHLQSNPLTTCRMLRELGLVDLLTTHGTRVLDQLSDFSKDLTGTGQRDTVQAAGRIIIDQKIEPEIVQALAKDLWYLQDRAAHQSRVALPNSLLDAQPATYKLTEERWQALDPLKKSFWVGQVQNLALLLGSLKPSTQESLYAVVSGSREFRGSLHNEPETAIFKDFANAQYNYSWRWRKTAEGTPVEPAEVSSLTPASRLQIGQMSNGMLKGIHVHGTEILDFLASAGQQLARGIHIEENFLRKQGDRPLDTLGLKDGSRLTLPLPVLDSLAALRHGEWLMARELSWFAPKQYHQPYPTNSGPQAGAHEIWDKLPERIKNHDRLNVFGDAFMLHWIEENNVNLAKQLRVKAVPGNPLKFDLEMGITG